MKKKVCKTHELKSYLIDTNNNNDLILLEWWWMNKRKYRNVARVAQNWLAVLSTFIPS